jgi:hypothetical protein
MMTTASDLVRAFIRHYPFGLRPQLDEIWRQAAAWEREAPPVPRGEDMDPYPRHNT